MRSKTITELFHGIKTDLQRAWQNLSITHLEYDSRRIKHGGLFIAVPGFKVDGHRFLAAVAAQGAVAAAVEKLNDSILIPQIKLPDTRAALAQLSYNFYLPEIAGINLVGITGTNGKTTTSYLIRSILEEAGLSCGLIGTIAHHFGGKKVMAQNTTPESLDLCRMLYEMAMDGQKYCVMEVSSHALSLHRVDRMIFQVGLFTNLTRDHMDFHKDEEEYFQAKALLFKLLDEKGSAVVNNDDAWGRRLMKMVDRQIISFGFSEGSQVRVREWQLADPGMVIRLDTPMGSMVINSRLISEFNVQNIMAAAAVGLAFHVDLPTIKHGLENVSAVPGRFETYEILPGVLGVIDYAHTPDALEKALMALRPLTKNRLIAVFGCGGDRDKGKRPQMGKIAEQLADFVIVTTDNPRSEDPLQIIDGILNGMSQKEKREAVADRRAAIAAAVKMSQSGDVILIAGKGHESYQDINGVKYDFNEAAILLEAARNA